MLTVSLPVSAPSDNDWALGVDSRGDFEFPTLIRGGTSGRCGPFPKVRETPILQSLLPVSAPSDNDWALGVDSRGDFEFPTLIRGGTSGRCGSDQQALQR
jgi:hypothetical protein